MSLNSAEIDLILQELDLTGSFIREIVQSTYNSLSLNVYKNGKAKNILICLAPGATRIHETFTAVPKNEKPLRFMQFLRSRIKGTRISQIAQIAHERIIKVLLTRNDEQYFMYIRLWSGAANIIVTDSDLKILDVFYRRPKRNEITGSQFTEIEPRKEENAANPKFTIIRSFDEVKTKNGTFNEKVDFWYREHAESLSLESLKESARQHFNQEHSRMTLALEKLQKKRDSFLNAEQWKHQGDLILNYGHLISGESDFLECEDYDSGKTVLIPIDKKKSAHDNAASYYEKYKKATSGLQDLEHDISKLKKEILDIEYIYEQIEKENNPLNIEQMLRKQTKPKEQLVKKTPGLTFSVNGWTILVGRDSSENDELLRHHAKGLDLWLHSRDTPGGFVFIKNRAGKSVPLEIMLDAAYLAMYFSKARKNTVADFYCTQVKYLRRAKNAPKGTVIPTNEKNLTIKLDKDRIKILIDEKQI